MTNAVAIIRSVLMPPPKRPLSVWLTIVWLAALTVRQAIMITAGANSRKASEFFLVAVSLLLLTANGLFRLLLGSRKTWVHRFVSIMLGIQTLTGALFLFATVVDPGQGARLYPTTILVPCLLQLFVVVLFYRFAFGEASCRFFQLAG